MSMAPRGTIKSKKRVRRSADERIFNIFAYPFIAFITALFLIPFWLIIAASVTDNSMIMQRGFALIPSRFSANAFRYIFAAPRAIGRAYGVSAYITALGTGIGLFVITMTGYVLNRRDFKYRNRFSFFIYFTTLFSGGMVPSYILMVTVLKLQNNYLSVILSGLMSPFLIIIMRNFMKSIPFELVEAAKVDGANDFAIFIRIILPLSSPGLATTGLFLALGYWNNWYSPMLYLTRSSMHPLQYYLYNILTAAQSAQQTGVIIAGMDSFPGESIKMAMAVVAIGPMMFLYPFLQKYFVRGITIGAVKG
jgi:putative aldouronate transport system permease protein